MPEGDGFYDDYGRAMAEEAARQRELNKDDGSYEWYLKHFNTGITGRNKPMSREQFEQYGTGGTRSNYWPSDYSPFYMPGYGNNPTPGQQKPRTREEYNYLVTIDGLGEHPPSFEEWSQGGGGTPPGLDWMTLMSSGGLFGQPQWPYGQMGGGMGNDWYYQGMPGYGYGGYPINSWYGGMMGNPFGGGGMGGFGGGMGGWGGGGMGGFGGGFGMDPMMMYFMQMLGGGMGGWGGFGGQGEANPAPRPGGPSQEELAQQEADYRAKNQMADFQPGGKYYEWYNSMDPYKRMDFQADLWNQYKWDPWNTGGTMNQQAMGDIVSQYEQWMDLNKQTPGSSTQTPPVATDPNTGNPWDTNVKKPTTGGNAA